MESLKKQLKNIPHKPGVYFFKNPKGKILYIGKASDLKNRVSQYFQKEIDSRPKLEKMIFQDADQIDFTQTDSEIEALLLESEMIKRYKPVYNDRWKDDKNFIWVEITLEDEWPKINLIRSPRSGKNVYLGPFVDSLAVRKSLRVLRRIFPFITSKTFPHKLCFWGHLKQCPCYGLSNKDYRLEIRRLINFFKGRRVRLLKDIEKQMFIFSNKKDYEKAAALRDKIKHLKKVSEMILEKANKNIYKDQALEELRLELKMIKISNRIECYDVSNLFGKEATGSMVVFTNGLPDKKAYRHFKVKKVNTINDYAMMQEILSRRLFKTSDEKFKILPDLIVIDGGKGQLSASKKVLDNLNLNIEIIGLAKRNEEVFIKNKGKQAGILEGTFRKIILDKNSHALLLLTRIRNEAHRFAITHHRRIREKKITTSSLEQIKGVGKVTQKKLLKKFGSICGLKKANFDKIEKLVGKKVARSIKIFYKNYL